MVLGLVVVAGAGDAVASLAVAGVRGAGGAGGAGGAAGEVVLELVLIVLRRLPTNHQ